MLAYVASLLIGVSAADSTPVRPISQWVHTKWTAKDGAPNEIRALAQTSDGYLWLGTVSSLVRFDGVRFVPFAPHAGDSLPTGGVRNLLAARDGSLWIVWRTGVVSRLRNGRVTSFGEQDGLPVTFELTESSTGTLVAGTAAGLARFTDGKWRDVGDEWGFRGTESKAVWFDRQDALWAQTKDRMVYLPSGGREFIDPGWLLRGVSALADFAEGKDGSIWMAEVFRSAHTLRRVGDQTPITEVLVGAWTLLIDRKGSLWIGTGGDGLRRIADPSKVRGRKVAQFGREAEHFTEREGLLSNVVDALLEDREGNIWVATSRGLERFREGAFTPIATPGSVRPRFVLARRDTSIWTAALGIPGVLRLGPRDRETVQVQGGFLLTLFQDASGVLWTVNGNGIFRLRGRRFLPVRVGRSDAGQLTAITVDPAGTVWVFDEKLGLLRLTDEGLAQVAPLDQPAFPLGRLFSDRRGRIWVAQDNRIALYDHGKLTLFAAAQGLGPREVKSFFEDRAGNVWAAGEEGVSKYEGDRFRNLPERQGVPGRSVYGMVEDEVGAWWMVTRTGVLRLAPGELDRALADSSYRLRHRTFDLLDGLPGLVTTGSWGPPVSRAPDGRIWVATDSGVASVDPRSLPRALPPPVLIEGVRIDGRELVPGGETPEIPAGTRDLEIDYTAATLAGSEQVQFRYQLDGEDPTWHDVGTRRRAYYTGLGPGEYRFRVSGSKGDGVWNEQGAALAFRVLPAWYQTLWFRVGVVLLIGAIGAAGAIAVQRRRHIRVQDALRGEYEATLAERTRIAQDLHDTLLQGFIGVTLQLKAAEGALPAKPEAAAETLRGAQRLARESLREARERVWDMRDSESGADDVPAALEAVARERTAGTGIEVSLEISGERRRFERRQETAAFRIGREAVANAVRHADPRRIEIAVKFEATAFGLEVRDDGRGFDPNEGEEARQRGHFGLTGIRERAIRMGGRCDVRARPGGGTIVTLALPLADSEASSRS